MKNKLFKTSALAVISIALLSACTPTSDTVKPTVSPTPTATATPTATPSATLTPTPAPVETTAPAPAPVPEPEPVAPDAVTLTADSLKVLNDGVEREFGYKQAPATAIAALNDVFGYEAEYYYTGDTQPCNYQVSEYTWGNFELSFPGQNDYTNEGYIIYVSGPENANDVTVQSTSGIVLGDSVEEAREAAGPDALFTQWDMTGSPDADQIFGSILDGQSKANPVGTTTRSDGYTYEIEPNGTLVLIDKGVVERLVSPQYVNADC